MVLQPLCCVQAEMLMAQKAEDILKNLWKVGGSWAECEWKVEGSWAECEWKVEGSCRCLTRAICEPTIHYM